MATRGLKSCWTERDIIHSLELSGQELVELQTRLCEACEIYYFTFVDSCILRKKTHFRLSNRSNRSTPSKPGKAEILGKFSINCSHHDTNSRSLSLMASVTLLLRSLRRRETHAVSAYKFVYISPYSRGYLEILRCLGIADYQKSHLFVFLAELCKRRREEDGAPVRRSQRYNRRCVW